MGDGSAQNEGIHLNVYGYTHEEVLILRDAFKSVFRPKG